MKVKPYQFGFATISDFRDHSNVTRLRTNRNQLINIYLIAEVKAVYSIKFIGLFPIFLSTSYTVQTGGRKPIMVSRFEACTDR